MLYVLQIFLYSSFIVIRENTNFYLKSDIINVNSTAENKYKLLKSKGFVIFSSS